MKKTKKDLLNSIILFSLSLLILAAMVSYSPYDIRFETSTPNLHVRNYIGVIGAYLAWFLFKMIGRAGFFLPFLLFIWGIGTLAEKPERKQIFKILSVALFFASLTTLFSSTGGADTVLQVERGGLLGFFIFNAMIGYFGALGVYIISITLSALSSLVATDFLIIPIFTFLFVRTWNLLGSLKKKRAPRKGSVTKAKTYPEPKLKPAVKVDAQAEKPQKKEEKENLPKFELPKFKPKPIPKPVAKKPVKIEPRIVGDYKLPSLDLLNAAVPESGSMFNDDLEANGRILEETLRDFGIETKVVDINKGPVVTRYELQPAPGVKVNKITVLSDDIALTMKAPTVRIVAPIPGKSAVGIEVPNATTTLVNLREILESSEYQKLAAKSKLTIALGKDISGKSVVADLGDMPHLLIAGTTGSGKTVCVNSMIMSMIYNATPEELKFIMVDPKMVELAIYNGLPHLLCPVVTNAKKASIALAWVVNEMEERYKLLAKIAARNIDAFNQKSEDKLPYIVVIIDELADLMMIAQQEVENAITRLAQLSRAVGIHIVLATQRPSVDVVTGVIKANFPARISFKVASKVDSRTVLDINGADKLLGKGDMLFLEPGNAKPIRAQGTLLTDAEIERVTEVIKKQREPIYNEEILERQKSGITGRGAIDKDEFFDEAVKMVLNTGQASVSMLQRRLRLGYTRAARLIDSMEEQGIVGPYRGSKPREILVKDYQTSESESPSGEVEEEQEIL